MRKIYFLLVSITMTMMANAQNVSVNPGGGSYPNLASAFAAINAGIHTGAITIGIVNSTTEPASGAVLNASGSGAASYTSVLIRPAYKFSASISGAATPGLPLIDFNGADNVTIDGIDFQPPPPPDGVIDTFDPRYSLNISNTTVSAVPGTSTIRFQGDASNNTITRCTVLGSATMGVGSVGGNIVFGPSAVTTGNDGNTVSNCDIGPAGANLPSKCIFSFGSANSNADPGIANSGITITGNHFFDYFSSTFSSAAIDINHGTVGTVISNNVFDQSAVRTMAVDNISHYAISIGNYNGNGYQITGNRIGFMTSTLGTNSNVSYSIVMRNNCHFYPIFLGVGTAAATSVQGNTIVGIAISGTSSGTKNSSPFCGIYVAGGLTNVGDITGNIIGSQSSTDNITYTSSAAPPGDVIGIFSNGNAALVTNNNVVGGITGSSSTGSVSIYGLYCNIRPGLAWTALNNTIGSSVPNSIRSTSAASGTMVQGIVLNSASASTLQGNTVRNLTAAGGTGTTNSASVAGIVINASAVNHSISRNTIFNLTNTSTTGATTVTGLQFTGGTANTVERNLIYGLTSATNDINAEVNGIRVGGGNTTYRNNMIRIGAGIANSPGSVASTSSVSGINGINEVLGTNNFWHNSVYIDGNPTAGAGASYSFNSTLTGNTRNIRNNIFYNARSNAGATGRNYAVKLNAATVNPPPATFMMDNNLYFANGAGGTLGFSLTTNISSLDLWQFLVKRDQVSIQADPLFVSATDLHLQPGSPAINKAFNLGVTNDYDGDSRPGANALYDIGADELDGIHTASANRFSDTNSDAITGDTPSLTNSGINKGEKPLTVSIEGLFPNPANSSVNVLVGSPAHNKVTLIVLDMTGKAVLQQMANVEEGSNTIAVDISRISHGNYFVKLVGNNCGTIVSKFVKQ